MEIVPTDHYNQPWFVYLTPPLQGLVRDSLQLWQLTTENRENLDIYDYSYITFPLAKAYEGFVKKYLLSLGLIDEHTFGSKRFRIGRAINPDVRPQHRDEHWLFDDLKRECGPLTAKMLWETWLECRNRTFHFFPNKSRALTYQEAGQYIEKMMQTMHQAISCQPAAIFGLETNSTDQQKEADE